MTRTVRITQVGSDWYDDQWGVLLRIEVLEDGEVRHRRWEWVPEGFEGPTLLLWYVEEEKASGGEYQPALLTLPPPW